MFSVCAIKPLSVYPASYSSLPVNSAFIIVASLWPQTLHQVFPFTWQSGCHDKPHTISISLYYKTKTELILKLEATAIEIASHFHVACVHNVCAIWSPEENLNFTPSFMQSHYVKMLYSDIKRVRGEMGGLAVWPEVKNTLVVFKNE